MRRGGKEVKGMQGNRRKIGSQRGDKDSVIGCESIDKCNSINIIEVGMRLREDREKGIETETLGKGWEADVCMGGKKERKQVCDDVYTSKRSRKGNRCGLEEKKEEKKQVGGSRR